MLVPVVVLDLTVTSCGLRRYCLEMRRIGAGHGRGEQGHLLLLRGGLEDLVDLFGEAHAQHLVGLVQHDVLEVGEVQRALVDVVDDAAGGADDDLGAAAQAGQLRAVGGAAVHGQDGEVVHVLA